MTDAVFVGGIGSSQPEFSREVLDSTKILEDVMLRLQGYVKLQSPDGTERIIKVSEKAYDDKVLTWMRGKLLEVLNKNMYLSSLSKEEMYREARYMALGFWDEIWISWHEYSFTPGQMTELLHLYSNFLSQAIRHPLQSGIRNFLQNTTSETTQRVQQTLNENKDSGIFGIKFGK